MYLLRSGYIIGIIWGLYLKVSIVPIFFVFGIILILGLKFGYVSLKTIKKYKFLILSFIVFAIISNIQILNLENKFNTLYKNIEDVNIIGTVISDRKETTYKASYTIALESLNNSLKFKGTNIIIYVSKEDYLRIKNFIDNIQKNITKTRLQSLKLVPAQFQEYIDGDDIRVYAFKNDIFAVKINSNTVDFREDENAQLTKIELPQKVINDCYKVMKILKLKYSGIDIRLNKNGEYVFIEANPAPMFIHAEKVTKYPLTKSLIDMLINL